MSEGSLQSTINRIIDRLNQLIPTYSSNSADAFAGGNVAVCIIDESTYGIVKPDLIGWDGGQPIRLQDGTVLSVGFSGINDLDIVIKAVAEVEGGQ